MSTLIIAVVVLLLLLAFFSGTEIAFLSASKLSIEVEKNKGTRLGNILGRFYQEPRKFLGSLLVGTNIVFVVLALLLTELFTPVFSTHLGYGWALLIVNTVIITLIVLIFGEFLPKVFGRLYANAIINALAYPLIGLQWILAIPTWCITSLSNIALKYIFRADVDVHEDVITRLDLQDFVEGTTSPAQSDIETDMFRNALHLKEIRVEYCMVPRPEIVYIDVSAPMEEFIKLFQSSRHSRILVVEGDLDHVLGYVHHQQLLNQSGSVRNQLFEIPFVPETMSAKDLMLNLIKGENSIACVVDEFGGTAGIVTLEDILEEIFGEIEDEHDEEEFIEEKINENEYRFSGRLHIDTLNEKFPELALPEDEYNTLSGYLVMTSGTIPEQGDSIQLGQYRFVCEAVTDKKIETVRVIRIPEID